MIQGGTGSTAINLQTGTGGTVTIGTNSAGTGVSYSDPTEDYHGAWTGNSSLTTFTFNPLSSVSANTTVFVIVDDGQSVLVNSVSDNSGGGHSWATSASEQTSGDGRHVTVYRTYTGSTGISTSNTISVQMNTVVNSGISSNVEIWVEQVNGLATSSPLDVGAATSGANTSDPATLSTAALSQNNVLTWEIMRTSQATTGCSSSASWKTTGITGNQQGSCLAWQHITGGSGNTVNGTFTTGFGNGTANWAMVVAAYDVAAASNNNLVINSLTKIIPNADSTTAFQIQNASASTNLFTVNTINGVIGIGAAPSSTGATLQVAGGISATSLDTASAGALTIGSTNATTTIGRAGAALTLQGSNFNVSSAGTVNIASGQTYQINGSDINTAGTLTNVAYLNAASQTFTGVNTFTGSGNGSTVVGTLFKNATNTSTAFQIQTSGNSNVLLADTANSTPRIIIGDNTTLPTTGASLITNIDSPASSLDLNLNTGGTSRKNQITFDLNGTQDYALGVDLTGSGADNFFIYQKSSNSAKLLIDATGNVGIGTGLATTAPAKLSLSASTTSTGGIQLGSDTNPIDFYRTGTSATKLTSSLAIQNTVNSTTGFQVQNAGGSALANADTTNMRVQINSSEATISAPGTPTTALVAAGNLSAATYCYKVTALDANGGESLPSTEGTCRASSGSNKEITVAWTAVTGASGYRIYRGTATGAENVYFPCAAVNSGSFTDTCTSSGTAYTFADLGASSGFSASVPTVASAYTSTNNSNTNLQLQVGGNGTPTGQLYVSGTVPSSANAGGLSTPAAPTVTPTCASTCATTWLYSVTAVNSAGGQTVASYIGSTAVGAATLDGSGNNQNVITWSAVTGAVSYNIYRDSSGGTPSSTGLIGNTTSLTFTDNAVAATSALPSAAISDTFIGGSANPTGVAVAGRYEYVSINGGFKIYDVSNPTNPTYITTVSGLSVSYVSTSSVQGHYL